MANVYGYLENRREDFLYRPTSERVRDFKEVMQLQLEPVLRQQGTRCMDCGVPFCSSIGCSLHNLIPEWNELISQGLWREAYERLALTSNFPEFTGRICPAPCESACTLAIQEAPVAIKQIELAIIERAFAEGWVQPRLAPRKTGCRIAVVGSGPAGLAAAQQLCRLGHDVTVFERSLHAGGLLRYGVPDFKLEKRFIERRLKQLIAEGLRIRTNVNVGIDLPLEKLQGGYDAILLAIGALQARELDISGRHLRGVHMAMDYLTQSNQRVSGEPWQGEEMHALGKRVVVIGAGDTASDCVGTAIRQGAVKVTQFSYKAQPRLWTLPHNPEWPHYPVHILEESSSHKEGCERDWDVATRGFVADAQGNLKAMECERVRWRTDKNGRQMVSIPGSHFQLEADMVLIAIGFSHAEHQPLVNGLQLDTDQRGNIQQHRYATSAARVFVAGDAQLGTSLVVHAMHHGRQAAEQINHYLQKNYYSRAI